MIETLEIWQIIVALVTLITSGIFFWFSFQFYHQKNFAYLFACLISAIVLVMLVISEYLIPDVLWLSNLSWILAFPGLPIILGICFAIAEGS